MSNGGREAALDWLQRLLDGMASARRLIYALPPRSLVEPMAAEVAGWLADLGLAGQVALHAIGAGWETRLGPQWRRDMHLPAVVIGPADVLASKALNRGYGVGRITRSIDFALTTNDAHWIFDEPGLCPRAVSTIRQLARMSASAGRCGSLEISSMSVAAPEPESLGLPGRREVRRLDAGAGDYPAIAAAAVSRHRAGTRTLIVMNTVAAAQKLYAALADAPVAVVLVHTQFRGRERAGRVAALAAEGGGEGQIVVATQVVEAGLRLDAALVVTEAAPGLSMALRAGPGHPDGAELCWLPPAGAPPYGEAQIEAAVASLSELEGQVVTAGRLAGLTAGVVPGPAGELGHADLIELFDTGLDVDIEHHVSDADDLEAQVVWATWETGPDGRPPADARVPSPEWWCRAPLAQVGALAARARVWRMDWAQRCWVALDPGERAVPGEILLVAAADGGYDAALGFDPDLTAMVPDCPSADPPDAAVAVSDWVSLRQHSEETRDQAAGLLASIAPVLTNTVLTNTVLTNTVLPGPALAAVVCAAYLHDAGKAHPIWQDALCALAADDDAERVDAGRPWAKSGTNGALVFAGDVVFRHELGSLLLLDGPLRGLVDGTADRDLVRYLVLAHHGRLRVQVSEPEAAGREAADPVLFGLEHGAVWSMPSGFGEPGLAGTREVELAVDLSLFSGDGDGSWAATVRGLLDRYGPFVLAYLETLVRVADWRASGGDPLPSRGS